MSATKSFTFKKVWEEAGGPLLSLLGLTDETNQEVSKTGQVKNVKKASAKKDAGGKADDQAKTSGKRKANCENGGPRKSADSSKRPKDGEKKSKARPVTSLVKEIGSSKVVDGKVKNIRNVSQPIQEMVDSTDLLNKGEHDALYERFTEQGYLLLRGVLDRRAVLEGHTRLIDHLKKIDAVDEAGEFNKKGGSNKHRGWTIQATTGEALAGPVPAGKTEAFQEGWKEACLDAPLQEVLNSDELLSVVTALCRGKEKGLKLAKGEEAYSPLVINPGFTWVRAKGRMEATNEHADYFYWKRSTDLFISVGDDTMYAVAGEEDRVQDHQDIPCDVCGSTEDDGDNVILLCDECDYGVHLQCKDPPETEVPEGSFFCHNCQPRWEMGSAWIPLHDFGPEQAGLCVLPGSHKFSNFDKTLMKDGDVPMAFYKEEGRNRTWHTARYRAGDLILFDLRLVHASTRNHQGSYRLSADTRWYLKPERRNWGLTPCTRFVKAAAENRLVWKNEIVKEEGGTAAASGQKQGHEHEEEDDDGSEETEEEEEEDGNHTSDEEGK